MLLKPMTGMEFLTFAHIFILERYNYFLVMTPVKGKKKTQKKQMYRGMFETEKSGNKTSSGETGLNIRTLAILKVGQD